MKLYRVLGGLHYQGSMFPPFCETQWTEDEKAARKAYGEVMLKHFKQSEIDIEILERSERDQLPISVEKPSTETFFLWIELEEVEINHKRIPPNDDIIEIANYDLKVLAERGLWLNGRKMSPKTMELILSQA